MHYSKCSCIWMTLHDSVALEAMARIRADCVNRSLLVGARRAPHGFRRLRVPPRLSPRLGVPSRVSPPDWRVSRGGRSLSVARWALLHEGDRPRAWPFTAGGAQPSVAGCVVAGHTQWAKCEVTIRMRAPRQMRMRGARSRVRRVPSRHDSTTNVHITCPTHPSLHPTSRLTFNATH